MDLLARLGSLLEQYPPEIIDHGNTLQAKSTNASAPHALAEAYRTLVTTGAKPTRAQCQLVDSCDQLQIACERSEETIVYGEFDDPTRYTEMALTDDGDLIYLLGALPTSNRFDLKYVVDFKAEKLIGDIMIAASRDGLLNAAHAVTSQGFLAALSQMAMLGEKGARFWIPDGVDQETALFSPATGRIICVIPRSEELRFSDMCIARHVPLHRIGVVDGDTLELQDGFAIPVSDLA